MQLRVGLADLAVLEKLRRAAARPFAAVRIAQEFPVPQRKWKLQLRLDLADGLSSSRRHETTSGHARFPGRIPRTRPLPSLKEVVEARVASEAKEERVAGRPA
jgi:hypothetical protein